MRRLGEILVDAKACARDRVVEALENQVLLGGRLGTNLLELGAVTEEDLARSLARQHAKRALWGVLRPQPEAIALLRAELADRLDVVPYELSARRLSVLCRDPRELSKLDEVAFRTGKVIEPVVVAEARLWAVLRESYGVERPLRGVDAAPGRAKVAAPRAPAPAPGGDLMDEEEFQRLYAGRTAGAAASPTSTSNSNANANANANATANSTSNANATPPAAPAAAPPPLPPPRPSPPPLSFADAMSALAGVADRSAIAAIVLRHARSRFRRAVLFTIHGRRADGWQGLGDGLTPQRVAGLHASLEGEGVLRTVVESRSHFLGPLARTEANVRLLRALAGGAPRNAFAMPILARGRVVNVLYADEGRGGTVDPGAVGELLILAARIGQSYDALVARAR